MREYNEVLFYRNLTQVNRTHPTDTNRIWSNPGVQWWNLHTEGREKVRRNSILISLAQRPDLFFCLRSSCKTHNTFWTLH